MYTGNNTQMSIVKKNRPSKKARNEQFGSLPASHVQDRRITEVITRLKKGIHNLPDGLYEVHGCKTRLSGRVLVATKNNDWISIGFCQKCGQPRPSVATIEKIDKHIVIILECGNSGCQVGMMKYVYVQDCSRIDVR